MLEVVCRKLFVGSCMLEVVCRNVQNTHYGFQLIQYIAPNMWEIVSGQINFGSLSKFEDLFKS